MVRINTVYTKSGDTGNTQLIGGKKVSKSDDRIACYGTIDELNAAIGLAIASLESSLHAGLQTSLVRIQNELFNVGTQLATPDAKRRTTMPDIGIKHIGQLEEEMDVLNESLPDLKSFVLPGGSHSSACFHMARTICRRAERAVVALAEEEEIDARHIRYLNRLSDALFVFGRYSLVSAGKEEELWKPESV